MFYIFHHVYDRRLRVLDYYIRLILPFVFTFLKVYLDGNDEYEELKNKRDVRMKDFSPSDISPGLLKVIYNNLDIANNIIWIDFYCCFFNSAQSDTNFII